MPTTNKINHLKLPVTPDKEVRCSARNHKQLPILSETSRRNNFLKESHVAQCKTYAKLTFDINGLSKPSTALQAFLIKIVDKLT